MGKSYTETMDKSYTDTAINPGQDSSNKHHRAIFNNCVAQLNIEVTDALINDVISTIGPDPQASVYQYELDKIGVSLYPDTAWPNTVADAFSPFKEDFFLPDSVNKGGESNTLAHVHSMPNVGTLRTHVDPDRGAVIYLPITPEGKNYSPLEMYFDNTIVRVPYARSFYVFNTKIPHAVFNTFPGRRTNLQCATSLSYVEFLEKYSKYLRE